MMAIAQFTVPGIPQGKGRPRITTRGGKPRSYTPEKTVAYENHVADIGKYFMDGREPYDGPVYLTVNAFFPIPKARAKAIKQSGGIPWHTTKPDGDNILKAISDGLNGIVWLDDKQVAFAKVLKQYGDRPCVHVIVEAL